MVTHATLPAIDAQSETAANLRRCDEMDFEGFNNRNWEIFAMVHDEDVIVVYPDGHQTAGIGAHVEEMKGLFTWAPDLRITDHTIRFGAGEWTAVAGTLTGSFTREMARPGELPLPPTGKSFAVPVSMLARWVGDRIVEKILFWDTGAVRTQIGMPV